MFFDPDQKNNERVTTTPRQHVNIVVCVFLFIYQCIQANFVHCRTRTAVALPSCFVLNKLLYLLRETTYLTDPGADPGGSIGAIVPHETNESYFIYHDFVQFGKQYSQYNSENSISKKT